MQDIIDQTIYELATTFNVPPPRVVIEELPPGVLGITSQDGSIMKISPRIKDVKMLKETVAHEFWHYLLIKKGVGASRKEHEISAGVFEQLWAKIKEGYYAKLYTCPRCGFLSPLEECVNCGYKQTEETNVLLCQCCGSLIKSHGNTAYCKNCGCEYTLSNDVSGFIAGFFIGVFVTALATTALGRRIAKASAKATAKGISRIGRKIAEKLEEK